MVSHEQILEHHPNFLPGLCAQGGESESRAGLDRASPGDGDSSDSQEAQFSSCRKSLDGLSCLSPSQFVLWLWITLCCSKRAEVRIHPSQGWQITNQILFIPAGTPFLVGGNSEALHPLVPKVGHRNLLCLG